MNNIEMLEGVNDIIGKLLDDTKDTIGKDDPKLYEQMFSRHKKILSETEDLKKEYKGA